jgi:hypothetical protein
MVPLLDVSGALAVADQQPAHRHGAEATIESAPMRESEQRTGSAPTPASVSPGLFRAMATGEEATRRLQAGGAVPAGS